jgi:hypothetical protein
MTIDKKLAGKILARTDRSAGELDRLKNEGKIDAKLASKLIHDLDSFADRLQIAAYGEASFKAHQAKVLKKDSDEKFMDTFDNPQKVIEGDADEEFMHKSGDIETFDSDDTTQVTDKFRSSKAKPTPVASARQASVAPRRPASPAPRAEKHWSE